MSKKLVHKYTFDASARTVVIPEIINIERMLMITNVTYNEIIYTFADNTRGASAYTIDANAKTTTIILDYDTTSQGVHTNPTQSGYSGAGVDATFTVTRNPNASYSVSITNAGSGYIANETITIVGSQLFGTSVNDATITVASVDGSGGITSATISGTAVLDTLQIFQEKDSTSFIPDKTYTDPVSKFRVSQPENLIDTDFEYGLQSTKWETLELIKNIPTFFSRNGDQDLDINTITTTQDSNLITVVTTIDHGLVQGNPIIVQGTARSTANGGFVVTKVINTTTFQYSAKAKMPTTQNIKETYTQIFLGSIYQGTEFKLANLDGIVTDNANPSTLTVTTDYPLGFAEETSFFLTNSVGQKVVNFDSTTVEHTNFTNQGKSTTVDAATGEVNVWSYGAVDTHNWRPIHDPSNGLIVKWFMQGTGGNSTITVNTAGGVETIRFNDSPHGFTDDQYVVYLHGDGNGAIGGLTDTRPYYVNVVDANTIYLSTSLNGSRVNLSNHGSTNNVSRSCFVTAFDPIQAFTSSSQEELRFNTIVPLVYTNPNQALMMTYTTTGGLSYMNDSDALASYTVTSGQIMFPRNPRTVNGQTYMQFNNSAGSIRNISSTTVNGGMILIEENPDANSIWYANHGLTTGDLIRFGSSSTSVPSGLSRNNYYKAHVVNANRIRFQYYTSSSLVNLTSQGSTSATVDFTGYTYVDGSDTVNAQQTITQAPEAVTYNVTVEPKSSDPNANAFYINGQEAQTLTLREGSTYTFDLSAPSAGGHPFKFSTTSDGTHNSGTEYTTGVTVTGTQGTAGAKVEIVVASGAPTLYYYCSVHSGMGGTANTPAPTTTTQGHGLSDGDAVLYTNEGNTTIGGLSNSQTYYVANATENDLQLATSQTGYSGADITFRHNTGGSQTTGYIYNYDYIRRTSHGFSTGDRVQYTVQSGIAPAGLRNGAFYYIRIINTNYFYLYRTLAGAQGNTAWPDRIRFGQTYSGVGRLRKTDVVDLTSVGTGTQKLTANVDGASDGVYNIKDTLTPTSFTLQASGQIPTRNINFDPQAAVWIEQDAIRIPDHFFRTGYSVTYTAGATPTGGLTSGTVYYVIRVSQNWIRLSASLSDAEGGTYISLTAQGVGLATLSTNNIIGEVLGQGTVSIDNESVFLNGLDTNFTSFFKTGDTVSLYDPETHIVRTVSSVDNTTDQFTTSTSHGFTDGDIVIYNADTARTGVSSGRLYYVKTVNTTIVTLHPTNADAIAGSNKVDVSGTGVGEELKKISGIGNTIEKDIAAVLSTSRIQLSEESTQALTGVNYSVGTSLLLRADGFALHRPFDGGVELIPSSNPDSQMIRQTRKYFRYQSGKGIQVSFAVNFSPTVQIERITTTGSNAYAYVYTKFPHRLTKNLPITIHDVPSVSGTDYFNGVHTVDNIEDDYSFRILLSSFPNTAQSTGGFGYYHVNTWSNSNLRCGLFDDQNGMFFEYDGQNLKCCRRKSIKQLSGSCTATFGQGDVVGNNTKFLSQVSVGDYIVLRGQSYLVTKIDSDTLLNVAPSYRGATASNIVMTLTENIKVNQADWNIDTADGTGPTGYVLDIHTIQMAYIDYSWYGAGKIRFGFKDQDGDVQYVHAFVHNNLETEAYMRSGNIPARYDIQNIGKPTYVPALAHWGTSVIMDGRFDDDKAYVFTASSNEAQLTGSASQTASAAAQYNGFYYGLKDNRLRSIGYALELNGQSALYTQFAENMAISGANLQANTQLDNPRDSRFSRQPYQPDILNSRGYSYNNQVLRDLLVIDRNPSGTTGTNSTYTITLASTGQPVNVDVPIVSIRLSPSVDTNTIGDLGEREVINRMQLILNSVGVLSTHACEVSLRLNGAINNTSWSGVQNPSLSQLVYHASNDEISGGLDVYKFRAQGGTGTSGRQPVLTNETLGEVATLGNAIMGGNNTYPDGPDILTVVARLTEDPSTVSTSNPFTISARVSWSESQA
jgi:hypothetical protein